MCNKKIITDIITCCIIQSTTRFGKQLFKFTKYSINTNIKQGVFHIHYNFFHRFEVQEKIYDTFIQTLKKKIRHY